MGPSAAGKTYFLNQIAKSFDFILYKELLNTSDINNLLKSSSMSGKQDNCEFLHENYINFCIDFINKNLTNCNQKINALRIFLTSCLNYEKIKHLEQNGYITIYDELLLHRAFSFITYSPDIENDTKKYFELTPLPDVAIICTAAKETIKERLKKKPKIPNCYKNLDEKNIDLHIEKSLYVCQIAEQTLKERGIDVVKLDLSSNFENNLNTTKRVINDKISKYKDDLKAQLLKTSASFQKNNTRHILKTKNVFYCSFSTPNFTIPKEESERNSEMIFKHFGIEKNNLKDKTVLDLGSNCGAMLFHASNYGIKKGIGIEYDKDKVILSNKVANLSKLDFLEFQQGNIDKINPADIGKFDIVFALAIDSHVNDKEHLFSILSKVTEKTLYFEGNSNCDIKYVQKKLKKYGFSKIKYLGFCNDDIRPSNNKRPMFVAQKKQKDYFKGLKALLKR